MNVKDIAIAKAGLSITAEDVKLEPAKMLKTKPRGVDYSERTLTPPDDARTIVPAINALTEADANIKKIEAVATGIRTDATQKAKKYEEKQGLTGLKQKMAPLAEKLTAEVEAVADRLGDTILEHKGTLTAVYDVLTAGTVSPTEADEQMISIISKYVEAGIAEKILQESKDAVDTLKQSRAKLSKQLAVWKSPKDIRKKVKQEVPKGTGASKTAGGISDILTGIANFFTNVISVVGDKLSGLVSAVDQGEPMIEQLKALLGNVTTGSKKQTADYRGSAEQFSNRHDYADVLIEAMSAESVLDDLVKAMSEDEARENFDYIARMNDLYFKDGQVVDAEEMGDDDDIEQEVDDQSMKFQRDETNAEAEDFMKDNNL